MSVASEFVRRINKFLPASTGQLSSSKFVLALALGTVLIYNYQVFSFSFDNLDYLSLNGLQILLTVFVVIFIFTALVFFVLAVISTHVLKAFAALVTVCNSVALYFMTTYHVVLDRTMMGNIFNTRIEESIEFLHPKLFAYVLILGVIPAWWIVRTKVAPVARIRTIGHFIITVVAGLVFVYANAGTSLWIDKHASSLGSVLLPWSYVGNPIRNALRESRANADLRELPLMESIDNEQVVVVLVIGETARAHSFSLNGYDRMTNPLLTEREVVYFRNATACSTYTTASIHCMLSHDGSHRGPYEVLPTYLQRNGIDVAWRSNNWGEPPVVVGSYEESTDLKSTCTSSNCEFDEVLLAGLEDRIKSSPDKQVLVILHTKGSHGPSYYTKYPQLFERFEPVCKSVELDQCTSEELTNAYDNSILYTDYFLDQTITLLESLEGIPTMLLYVSDHGESLGEYGLYLHGTPFSIAPDVQKKIPFILWMSDSFKTSRNIRPSQAWPEEVSHDNVFHTILGAFGIQGDAYDKKLDVLDQEIR